VSKPRTRHARVTSGIAIGAAALLLAACGSSTTGGASSSASGSGTASASPSSTLPKTLVFSPLSLAPPALKGLSEGVKAYGGKQGWEVIVQDPNFDAAKQVQQLTEVIDSGRAGAVWTIANSPSAMGAIITSAQGKGVPILVNGTPQEWGFDGAQAGVTFDYIDYTVAGNNMGSQLGKCITEKLGGNATVLFGTGAAGSAGKAEYDKAALSSLAAAAPNAKVVSTLIITDRAKAQTDIGNALQGNPGINAVMSQGDEGPLAAIGAFAAAGKELPCVVAGTAGNPETLAAVKSGKMYAVNALQFGADMAQSFDTLVTMQADPTAKGLILTVPQKIITASG
jgi:ABC-type sugar transport system substrate-binding protein